MNSKVAQYNRYDYYIFIIIVSVVFGKLGGALMIPRVLAIVFLPLLLSRIKNSQKLLSGYFKIFLFFYLFCLVSLLWTPDKTQALKELVYYPVHFLLYFEILVFSRYSKAPLETIPWAWVVSVAISVVVAFWEIKTGNHLRLSTFEAEDITLSMGGVRVERPFASVTFGNFNGYVTYLCFTMPFLFFYLLRNIKNIVRTFIVIIVIVSAILTILVNASRGGLLTVALMGAILLLMTKRSIYKTTLVAIAIVGIVLYILPNWDSFFLAMSMKSEGSDLFTDESRFVIWQNALRAFSNYWYIGTGVGGLMAAMEEVHSHITITHNLLLEILVQFGFPFLIIVLSYLLKLFKRGRIATDRTFKVLLFLAIIAFPIYSIIDSGYLLNPLVYVAFSCLTVVAYIDRIKPDSIKKQYDL